MKNGVRLDYMDNLMNKSFFSIFKLINKVSLIK